LLSDPRVLAECMAWLHAECSRQPWKYVELRPLSQIRDSESGLQPSRSYYIHELDLNPSVDQLFRNLHKDSIQRRIQRAEREELSLITGRSEELVNDLYRLILRTRKRHHLLPQPHAWFKNLVECMGDKVEIRLARKNDTPIAGILTLRHGTTVTYKYGCSDERLHYLGVMPLLLWNVIQESKAAGVETIDFGRSDLDQESLIAFKGKFGTTKRLLNYYRYPRASTRKPMAWGEDAVRQVFSMLPDSVSSTAGRLVYRHIG